MRLWIDLDRRIRAHAVHDLLVAAAAHPHVEIMGLSVDGTDAREEAAEVHRAATALGHTDMLVYNGVADPRALDAAEAMVVVGASTNVARLARHSIELPPLVVCEPTFEDDAPAAAIVAATARDVLIVPRGVMEVATIEPSAIALFALLGEHVVIGRRRIGVGLDGALIQRATGPEARADVDATGIDVDALVERDVVVAADVSAMAVRIPR